MEHKASCVWLHIVYCGLDRLPEPDNSHGTGCHRVLCSFWWWWPNDTHAKLSERMVQFSRQHMNDKQWDISWLCMCIVWTHLATGEKAGCKLGKSGKRECYSAATVTVPIIPYPGSQHALLYCIIAIVMPGLQNCHNQACAAPAGQCQVLGTCLDTMSLVHPFPFLRWAESQPDLSEADMITCNML